MIKKLTLATRRSRLALAQAAIVREQLQAQHPQLTIDLVKITSEGDQLKEASLADYGGKGLFTRAIDRALLEHKADIAVHSVKDIPVESNTELVFAAFVKAGDARDAFVSNHHQSISDLPLKATLGTSSLRRQCLVKLLRPDLTVTNIRGNIDTRLHKLDQGRFDAIIIAAAGLMRLGLAHRLNQTLGMAEGFIPGIGQGVIGLQCRRDDQRSLELLQKIDDAKTRARVIAERALSRALGGNCYLPIAAYGQIYDKIMQLNAMVGRADGSLAIRCSQQGNIAEPEQIGKALAELMSQHGAETIVGPYR
jgi:hydroxymethylbilane synthase